MTSYFRVPAGRIAGNPASSHRRAERGGGAYQLVAARAVKQEFIGGMVIREALGVLVVAEMEEAVRQAAGENDPPTENPS